MNTRNSSAGLLAERANLTPIRFLLRFKVAVAAILLLALASPSHAFDDQEDFLPVEAAYQLFVEGSVVDGNFAGYLNWTIAPEHYLYRHQFALKAIPLDADGKPTNAATSADLNFAAGKEKYDDYYEKNLEVYYGATEQSFSLPIQAPFLLQAESQGCADAGLCYPPRKQVYRINSDGSIVDSDKKAWRAALSALEDAGALETDASALTSNTETAGNTSKTVEPSAEAGSSKSLLALLAGAFIGGLILNLMPCVFPVLSLKALSFVAHGSAAKQHGIVYTLGVICSFAVFAIIIVAAKSGGTALGWGFQLQSPLFNAALFFLFLLMGLALAGVFEFGASMMGFGQSLTQGSGLKASFFTGVLAVLVASPCTAPFMAGAIGAILTETAPVVLLIFIAMGFGLALPILLLSFNPKLADALPNPGPWMETFKQIMAFPLFLTCVWLLYVFGRQTSLFNACLLVAGGIFLVFGLWLLGKRFSSNAGRWLSRGAATISLLATVMFVAESRQSSADAISGYQPYTQTALSTAIVDEKPVFLYATADWCITCKVNERTVLKTEAVEKALEDGGFVRLVADYTNEAPEITEMLNRYGRNGVPLYVVILPGESPRILPQILTKSAFIDSLKSPG